MRSRITIFLLGLALIATMAITGCALFGDDDDDDVYAGTSATIKGSISATDGASLREGLRAVAAPTTATITFSYFDSNGNPVTLVSGVAIQFSGTSAPYEFVVTLPAEALQKRNFILSAKTDTDETIEGVVPFDPNTETSVTVPTIDRTGAGPVAFVKAATIAGVPNVGMGEVLSAYTPNDLKTLTANAISTLVTQFKAREQAIQTIITNNAGDATKIQQLINYSNQLARNSSYFGFANRDDYDALVKAKATELGLTSTVFNAIGKATTDIWSELPPPPSAPAGFGDYEGNQATDDSNTPEQPGTSGDTTIRGSISSAEVEGSLRMQAVAPTSATIEFSYIDANGNTVPIMTGFTVTFTGTTANYEFKVDVPAAALLKRNFILKAVTNTQESIEGVVPFDPNSETSVTVPVIDPNAIGPVALAKAAAKAGVPNIGMGDVLSIYTPTDLKAMINLDGTLKAEMTTLVTKLQERDQAIQEALAGFADQAAKIQQMMDYSFQLARNPDYIGFANREKFEAAMKAKAIELGLPVDAMSAIDAMEVEFVGSGLPTPPSQPDLNFDNFSRATEQKRELEMLGNAMTYFAGLLNNNELNEIKARFVTAAESFFAQMLAGTPIQPAAHPFFILDEARVVIFEALGGANDVVNASILVKEADMQGIAIGEMPTPEQIIEHKKALFELVIGRINAQYANLVGAPTDATEKAKFIQALAALASIPMAPQPPGSIR